MSEQDVHADRGTGVGTLVLSCLFALVVGAIAGLITTFAHAQLAPWGLVGGLAIAAAIVLGFRLVFERRLAGAAAAIGFLAAAIPLAFPGAGAPVLVLDGPLGWIWLLGALVVATAALVQPWPDGWPGRRSERL